MTKDIWVEKPAICYMLNHLGKGQDFPYYNAKDMDTWLEKLKFSFDESITDCDHSLELVAKNLGKYMEKAEKWNELCEGLEYGGNTPVRDILQEINLIDRDNELRRNKLEAIETLVTKWRTEIKEYPDTPEGQFAKVAVGLCSTELKDTVEAED